MGDKLTTQELLVLADFILLEANGPGKFTSMRFTHEKWMSIAAALRLAAKLADEVRHWTDQLAFLEHDLDAWSRSNGIDEAERRTVHSVVVRLTNIRKGLTALSPTGEPKPTERPAKIPRPWIDAEEGDMS